MGYSLLHVFVYGLAPAIILAASDPAYNASLPFRPNNVTGLSPLYQWVGSYYNATTQIEITPLLGATANQSACANVQNKIFTSEFTSFLAITERGPYNTGSNPVNTLLTLWQPGANLTSLSQTVWDNPSLELYLESAPWVYKVSDNGIASDDFGSSDSVQDVFNLTLVSSTTRAPPYNLIGEIIYTGLTSLVDSFKVDLASCNTSIESSEFQVSLTEYPAPNIAGSNWTYPVVTLQFDSEAANLTVDGYFFATPNMLNSTVDLGPDSVQGKIKIAFLGVIDPYHSDMLVNNSATPTWLRTVGFNNNSLNIGYDSGGPHGWPRPQAWSVFATTLLISILATCK